MSDVKSFNLPDVGEGLTEADVLDWRVAVGDTVEVNQIIVEIETAKAAVELPSPFAGTVTELLCAAGDTVEVGRPIIRIDVDPGGGGAPAAAPAPETAVAGETSGQAARQPVLVGYGPAAEGAAGRRKRRGPSAHSAFTVPPSAAPETAESPETPEVAEVAATPEAGGAVGNGNRVAAAGPARGDGHARAHGVLAKPPVRKLARDLGVDLASVTATGPGGTVSRDDVTAAAAGGGASVAPADPAGRRETRLPIKGVRKHTAAAMVGSAFTAPHVTEFVTCDVSAMMELRDRVAARGEFRDVKVSPLVFVAKAVILAAARTPEINATWDEDAGEIVLKHYVNLGIAAATGRGLIVPNIKDADQLSLRGLATAITELTEVARAGRTTPEDMADGTITITNVGVFGVDTGTPILNPGEAGIVAFGAVRRAPWVVGTGDDERVEPRWVTQLAASFDHRLVDGAQGSQFLADVAGVLSDPGLALL